MMNERLIDSIDRCRFVKVRVILWWRNWIIVVDVVEKWVRRWKLRWWKIATLVVAMIRRCVDDSLVEKKWEIRRESFNNCWVCIEFVVALFYLLCVDVVDLTRNNCLIERVTVRNILFSHQERHIRNIYFVISHWWVWKWIDVMLSQTTLTLQNFNRSCSWKMFWTFLFELSISEYVRNWLSRMIDDFFSLSKELWLRALSRRFAKSNMISIRELVWIRKESEMILNDINVRNWMKNLIRNYDRNTDKFKNKNRAVDLKFDINNNWKDIFLNLSKNSIFFECFTSYTKLQLFLN